MPWLQGEIAELQQEIKDLELFLQMRPGVLRADAHSKSPVKKGNDCNRWRLSASAATLQVG